MNDDKFYKNFKIVRIVLYTLTAVFLLLQFVWYPFVYFALVSAVLVLISLSVNELFLYVDLKKRIEKGYDLYLQDQYRNGAISKEQFETKTQSLYSVYKKMYLKEKLVRIGLFILFFGLAVTLIGTFIKVVF